MKRLGFTTQKPIRIAYEQNPKVVKKWLKKIILKLLNKLKERELKYTGWMKQA